MAGKTMNLSFVALNVRMQLRAARAVIETAERMDEIADGLSDPAAAAAIRSQGQSLMRSADDLISNASTTGATVSRFLVGSC